MDLTNVVDAADILKPFKSPIKKNMDIASGFLIAPDTESPADDKAGSMLSSSVEKDLFEEDERKTNSPSDDAGSSPPTDSSPLSFGSSPSTEGPPGLEAPKNFATAEPDHCQDCQINLDADDGSFGSCSGSETGDESEVYTHVMEGDLPSIGSALHLAGECKRCNFFLKGRCQNGKDCEFCHFPHDKRKHSRQEKRDRKASWMEEAHGEDAQEFTGQLLKPGLIGQTRPAALSADAAAWQPEAAAYMLAMSEANPWLVDQCESQQFVSSAPLPSASMAIFSTVPTPASSVAPTPNASCFPTPMPTPTGSAAPRMMFSTSVTDYVCLEAEATKTSLEAEAVSCSVDDHQWSREDLLRLRDSVDKASGSIGIRTAANTAAGIC